jgi:hypothetical protein
VSDDALLPSAARHFLAHTLFILLSTSSIVPQFHAWVEVGGKPLQIYGATETEKKAVGYIEAKEGEEFTVHFGDQRNTRPEYHYSAVLLIDGVW